MDPWTLRFQAMVHLRWAVPSECSGRSCGHLKITAYTTAVNGVPELKRKAQDGCELIRSTPGIFQHVACDIS